MARREQPIQIVLVNSFQFAKEWLGALAVQKLVKTGTDRNSSLAAVRVRRSVLFGRALTIGVGFDHLAVGVKVLIVGECSKSTGGLGVGGGVEEGVDGDGVWCSGDDGGGGNTDAGTCSRKRKLSELIMLIDDKS